MAPRVALFRFYAELNDFLPARLRFAEVEYRFTGTPAVKDAIEALGIPHPEVEMILVNGVFSGFDRQLQDGDRVSVYPMFESFDVGAPSRVRPQPLREPKFALDVHLGKLAGYLRLLGFDAAYTPEADDAQLARLAADEHRILLTRDRQLVKRRIITHGYCVRSDQPFDQAVEVVRRFDLGGMAAPFTRCLACNGRLEKVERAEVLPELPPGVGELQEDFTRCAGCARVYWKGTHYARLERLAAGILAGAASGQIGPRADGGAQD